MSEDRKRREREREREKLTHIHTHVDVGKEVIISVSALVNLLHKYKSP
jgi:hypothetical protein